MPRWSIFGGKDKSPEGSPTSGAGSPGSSTSPRKNDASPTNSFDKQSGQAFGGKDVVVNNHLLQKYARRHPLALRRSEPDIRMVYRLEWKLGVFLNADCYSELYTDVPRCPLLLT